MYSVPSYLAANMACPGDVDVRYSIHSRLSVEAMVTGNLEGMLDPQNRAAMIHRAAEFLHPSATLTVCWRGI